MRDIEETTSKGEEQLDGGLKPKIDKMQQDLGDFIDELESGNVYAGDEDEFATNEEIGGQFDDENLENELNTDFDTFFDPMTSEKEAMSKLNNQAEDPDAVIEDI